ncbi:MAG TPA: hypothetical protein VK862_07445 [Afifellaceae bacterium]|nr:hypothetical protein [Afifellaceae bacterium]
MGDISTTDLSQLPAVPQLRKIMQSLAMLDAIISPEWEYRYYSFNSAWGLGEQVGSMRNGSGDEFFALFNWHGCFMKGFDHEASVNQLNLDSKLFYSAVPADFTQATSEPAFSPQDVTFCLWRLNIDERWSSSDIDLAEMAGEDDPDGSSWMLSLLDGLPDKYCTFAEDYDEHAIDRDAVTAIYQHQKLTGRLIDQLNADSDIGQVRQDAAEIGYPCE